MAPSLRKQEVRFHRRGQQLRYNCDDSIMRRVAADISFFQKKSPVIVKESERESERECEAEKWQGGREIIDGRLV